MPASELLIASWRGGRKIEEGSWPKNEDTPSLGLPDVELSSPHLQWPDSSKDLTASNGVS